MRSDGRSRVVIEAETLRFARGPGLHEKVGCTQQFDERGPSVVRGEVERDAAADDSLRQGPALRAATGSVDPGDQPGYAAVAASVQQHLTHDAPRRRSSLP